MSLNNHSAYVAGGAKTRGAPLQATTPLLAALLPIAPVILAKDLQDDAAGVTPFVAKFTITSNLALVHPDVTGGFVNDGIIARDRFGRVLQETFMRDREGRVFDRSTVIFDGDRTLHLDPNRKVAFDERNLPLEVENLQPPNKVFREVRDLGKRTIRGLLCSGKENSAGPDDVMEVWTSDELDTVVLRIHRQPSGLVSTFTLTEVRLGEELPLERYEIPAGYSLVDETEWKRCCGAPRLPPPQPN